MNQSLLSPKSDFVDDRKKPGYNLPAISIILPFEPKMRSKRELLDALHLTVEKVEQELFEKFSADMAMLVMHKLKTA